MPAPTLLWFRQDLRLSDHAALLAAIDRGGPVVPVFIWAPEEEGEWPPGAASRWWLDRSLTSLNAALRARGSRLIVRRGPSLAALRDLVRETGATAVHWSRRYEPASVARDKSVKEALRADGLHAESFASALLVEPWELRTAGGTPYKVFTPFWRALASGPRPLAPVKTPPRISAPSTWPSSLTIEEMGLAPRIAWDSGLAREWTPGEPGARTMLDDFVEGAVRDYAAQRDRPDKRSTSRLSPHLHFGEISPRQAWHAGIALGTPGESWMRQVAWREFAMHLLFHFPQSDLRPLRPAFERFPWKPDAALFEAWSRGRTGYPIVDAGMRELWETGWMHGRVRMIVASFLVKDLLIPWQDGARWFWDTLVDADLANNTLGWQWVAGCGADAAPYFRVFNPASQAEKFDPRGAYVRRWCPEIGTPSYPRPIVDHSEARLAALAALRTISRDARPLPDEAPLD